MQITDWSGRHGAHPERKLQQAITMGSLIVVERVRLLQAQRPRVMATNAQLLVDIDGCLRVSTTRLEAYVTLMYAPFSAMIRSYIDIVWLC
jgi:hypothetical protein